MLYAVNCYLTTKVHATSFMYLTPIQMTSLQRFYNYLSKIKFQSIR